ncbi:MAG: hypothetical protein ACUZ8N_03665 [Candidatus Scalindua sp.]
MSDFVAATLRLRSLREIHIHPSDDEKRRLKPSATMAYNIKSLNLGQTEIEYHEKILGLIEEAKGVRNNIVLLCKIFFSPFT